MRASLHLCDRNDGVADLGNAALTCALHLCQCQQLQAFVQSSARLTLHKWNCRLSSHRMRILLQHPNALWPTDLMLPNDLDLDLMFGDGMDGLLGGPDASVIGGELPLPADQPPIGLCLRKSQSLVDLINAKLRSGTVTGAAVEVEAAASGVAPMQCA